MEKLQSLKVQYESLKMKDEENILEYFKRFENLVNAIQGLGVEVPDREKLEDLTMDELYGILTAYELILGIDNLPEGEVDFKVIKKTKKS